MRISDWSSDVCSSDLTEDDALDLLVGGRRAIRHDAAEMRLADKVRPLRHGQLVAQQRLGRHNDQRLAERAQHLAAQDVKIVRRGRNIATLDIVAGAELEEALEARRAMPGALQLGRASWRDRGCEYV